MQPAATNSFTSCFAHKSVIPSLHNNVRTFSYHRGRGYTVGENELRSLRTKKAKTINI